MRFSDWLETTPDNGGFRWVRRGDCDVCNRPERLNQEGQCEECSQPEHWNDGLRTSTLNNWVPSNPPSDNQLRRYGMSSADWWDLFERQGEKCAVCRSPTAFAANWHTDHDHGVETALGIILVRGILCLECNLKLAHDGRWSEEPAFVWYLTETPLHIFGTERKVTNQEIRRWQPDYQIAMLVRNQWEGKIA